MDPMWNIDVASERAYPTPYAASPWLPLLLMSLASQKHSPCIKNDFRNEYDYIIVGAGSAGSVVASRLSEIPCVNVLLLEAGKPPPRLTDLPVVGNKFFNTDIDWQFKTTPQRYTAAGMKDRKVPIEGGKMLGGSSSMNSMIYVRGNRRNYDEWASLGAEGWSYEEVLPYFKKLEDNTDPAYLANARYHASGGPITVSRPSFYPEQKLALIEAVLKEGYTFTDPNAEQQIGFYDCQFNIRRGQRCGTAKAYLVPSENRTNLDIVPNAMVRKILIENKKAVGVEFDYNGLTRYVTAKREVIVSAGTINTAKLLMLSGIGPMNELKKHNIPLVADLPVGLNFQDHPAVGFFYEVNNNLPSLLSEVLKESNIVDYIDRRTGPLTSSHGILLMSSLSNSDQYLLDSIPDYSLFFTDSFPPNQEVTNTSFLSCLSEILHPYSVGTVSLHSSDPYDQAEIDPNYFADFRDINDMVGGLRTCNRIMNNPAMKRIGTRPIGVPIPGCETFIGDEDLYLRCIVRTRTVTTRHLVGTSRMGDPKDPRTVVDPQLRVKGIKGLRVVDASIMPIVPWCNTNIPTIMVAEKASDIIKSTIQCAPEPAFKKQPFPTSPNIPLPWIF